MVILVQRRFMPNFKICFFLLYLCAFSVGTMAAEVYRWVDESGQVHFGDKPREGAEILEVDEPLRQSDSLNDQQRLEANRIWFAQQLQRRLAKEQAQQKAAKKANSKISKQQERCSRQSKKLADKETELAVKKRAGLRVSEESRLKLQIELLEQKFARECSG